MEVKIKDIYVIKEIEKLNKKENIEKIALIQNQIKDIEELPNIIKPFKNLKSLDLRNNPDTKEKVENVLKTIKKMDGFTEFKILYGKEK